LLICCAVFIDKPRLPDYFHFVRLHEDILDDMFSFAYARLRYFARRLFLMPMLMIFTRSA